MPNNWFIDLVMLLMYLLGNFRQPTDTFILFHNYIFCTLMSRFRINERKTRSIQVHGPWNPINNHKTWATDLVLSFLTAKIHRKICSVTHPHCPESKRIPLLGESKSFLALSSETNILVRGSFKGWWIEKQLPGLEFWCIICLSLRMPMTSHMERRKVKEVH